MSDIDPDQGRCDPVDDVADRLGHPLAIPPFAAIAELDRLERAGRRPGGHGAPSESASRCVDFRLHRWVAP